MDGDRDFDLFTFLGVMVLMAAIVALYEWLVPFELRLSPGWEEPAFLATLYLIVMLLMFHGLRAKFSFWFSLIISLGAHLWLTHKFIAYRTTHLGGLFWKTAQLSFVIALAIWILVFSACSFVSSKLLHAPSPNHRQ